MTPSGSEGNLLEDDALVSKLNDAKDTSIQIREQMISSEMTEREINATRIVYTLTARKGESSMRFDAEWDDSC